MSIHEINPLPKEEKPSFKERTLGLLEKVTSPAIKIGRAVKNQVSLISNDYEITDSQVDPEHRPEQAPTNLTSQREKTSTTALELKDFLRECKKLKVKVTDGQISDRSIHIEVGKNTVLAYLNKRLRIKTAAADQLTSCKLTQVKEMSVAIEASGILNHFSKVKIHESSSEVNQAVGLDPKFAHIAINATFEENIRNLRTQSILSALQKKLPKLNLYYDLENGPITPKLVQDISEFMKCCKNKIPSTAFLVGISRESKRNSIPNHSLFFDIDKTVDENIKLNEGNLSTSTGNANTSNSVKERQYSLDYIENEIGEHVRDSVKMNLFDDKETRLNKEDIDELRVFLSLYPAKQLKQMGIKTMSLFSSKKSANVRDIYRPTNDVTFYWDIDSDLQENLDALFQFSIANAYKIGNSRKSPLKWVRENHEARTSPKNNLDVQIATHNGDLAASQRQRFFALSPYINRLPSYIEGIVLKDSQSIGEGMVTEVSETSSTREHDLKTAELTMLANLKRDHKLSIDIGGTDNDPETDKRVIENAVRKIEKINALEAKYNEHKTQRSAVPVKNTQPRNVTPTSALAQTPPSQTHTKPVRSAPAMRFTTPAVARSIKQTPSKEEIEPTPIAEATYNDTIRTRATTPIVSRPAPAKAVRAEPKVAQTQSIDGSHNDTIRNYTPTQLQEAALFDAKTLPRISILSSALNKTSDLLGDAGGAIRKGFDIATNKTLNFFKTIGATTSKGYDVAINKNLAPISLFAGHKISGLFGKIKAGLANKKAQLPTTTEIGARIKTATERAPSFTDLKESSLRLTTGIRGKFSAAKKHLPDSESLVRSAEDLKANMRAIVDLNKEKAPTTDDLNNSAQNLRANISAILETAKDKIPDFTEFGEEVKEIASVTRDNLAAAYEVIMDKFITPGISKIKTGTKNIVNSSRVRTATAAAATLIAGSGAIGIGTFATLKHMESSSRERIAAITQPTDNNDTSKTLADRIRPLSAPTPTKLNPKRLETAKFVITNNVPTEEATAIPVEQGVKTSASAMPNIKPISAAKPTQPAAPTKTAPVMIEIPVAKAAAEKEATLTPAKSKAGGLDKLIAIAKTFKPNPAYLTPPPLPSKKLAAAATHEARATEAQQPATEECAPTSYSYVKNHDKENCKLDYVSAENSERLESFSKLEKRFASLGLPLQKMNELKFIENATHTFTRGETLFPIIKATGANQHTAFRIMSAMLRANINVDLMEVGDTISFSSANGGTLDADIGGERVKITNLLSKKSASIKRHTTANPSQEELASVEEEVGEENVIAINTGTKSTQLNESEISPNELAEIPCANDYDVVRINTGSKFKQFIESEISEEELGEMPFASASDVKYQGSLEERHMPFASSKDISSLDLEQAA